MIRGRIEPSGGVFSLTGDVGVASLIDAGVGQYTLVFEVDAEDSFYPVVMTAQDGYLAFEHSVHDRSKSEISIFVTDLVGSYSDEVVNVCAFV